MRRFEVLLHGRQLTLLDEEGTRRAGGVFAWRGVDADDEGSAVSRAKESLLHDPMFFGELWGPSAEAVVLEVEEIRERTEGSPGRDSSPVFYIEEAE